jgi:NADPH-dependent curcumin reductase
VTNRRITLAARPVGLPAASDFELGEANVPEPGAGEVLVRTLWLSLDPYQRGRMSTAHSYARPVELGEVITAEGVAEVVESRDPRYGAGEIVAGSFGWQEYAVARAGSVRRVDPALAPVQTALHVLGMTGLTAYFGLYDVARPLPGETVVVSAASGAVGQVVGQLARIAGCRAVGLAGSSEKVADLADYGYETGIDYRRDDLGDALKAACPDGVDVYFDNVGGVVSDAVFRRLALGARVAVCGLISQYNLAEPELAPRNLGFFIVKRVRMQGFLVTDYAHRFPAVLRQLGRWVADGSLRYREDVVEGLEHAPQAFIGLMRGENRGKLLVKL